ncbi:hypothetical protein BDV98DRAFT_572063 [Pterulicium gracile]|uniref:Uncharacterized protein n=1 Tax=Pterulicium gracile TaxID=1884261 RepID=A0A5C3QEV5_9AGAR|nr:hypothetical protein BDV98DRAFT_572063 [Pterula gracilis]
MQSQGRATFSYSYRGALRALRAVANEHCASGAQLPQTLLTESLPAFSACAPFRQLSRGNETGQRVLSMAPL